MSQRKAKTSVNEEIDDNLRRVFNQTLEEDIPDRFKTLLDQLAAKKEQTGQGEQS